LDLDAVLGGELGGSSDGCTIDGDRYRSREGEILEVNAGRLVVTNWILLRIFVKVREAIEFRLGW